MRNPPICVAFTRKNLPWGWLCALIIAVTMLTHPVPALAQQIKPTPAMAKQVMKLTKGSWVQFRNYGGKQYLYFTHFFAWKCALKEVRYSVNSNALDKVIAMPECNPDLPFDVNPKKENIYVTFPLGHAEDMSVQIIYKDDSKSEVLKFVPCDVERDQSCAKLVE